MTFETTKIGDRWFLVFEEGLFRIDEVAEIWTTYALNPIEPGQVRVRSTLGGFEDVTPVKPSLLQGETGNQYHERKMAEYYRECSDKPSQQQAAGPAAATNPKFSDELNRHYAKPKLIPLMTLTGTCDTCTCCDSQYDIAYDHCPNCGKVVK